MSGRDRIAILLAVTIAAIAVLVGVRTGLEEVDVDEIVYHDTLVAMRGGEGYYDAMRDALVEKEGAPPSSVRAVRPPTMFLMLRWLPESSWRYVVGLVYLAILLLAFLIGRPYGRFGGVIAVGLAGFWVLAAAPFLFVHAELWGLPFFLGAVLAARKERQGTSAMLLLGATLTRELYGTGLLVGALVFRRRLPWLGTSIAAVVAAIGHGLLARSILAAQGTEAALGNEPRTIIKILTIISPGDRPLSWVIGTVVLVVGLTALIQRWHADQAAKLLLPFVLIMIPASIIATRTYWGLTFGPALAAFVPAVRAPRR